MVYLVVTVIILHFISLPMVLCVSVGADSENDVCNIALGMFYITVFKKSVSFDEVKKRSTNKATDKEKPFVTENNKKKERRRVPIVFLKNVLSVLRIRILRLIGVIGLGDAAATAMTVGAVRILFDNVCDMSGYNGGVCDVSADFDGETVKVCFVGIISLCIADIIYAAVKTLFGASKRRDHANIVAE